MSEENGRNPTGVRNPLCIVKNICSEQLKYKEIKDFGC